MQVDHDLNGRVFFQRRCDDRLRVVVGAAPLETAFFHVKCLCNMKHFVSVLLFQKLLQIITEADYRVRSFSRTGIGEGFLRMGMIDQNLRAFGIFRQGQVFSEQGAAVDLARQDRSVWIDNEEAVQERLRVSKKVR